QGTLTSIGVATGAQVKNLGVSQTAVWKGVTIGANDTLVMYTYGGDANLDGKINVDDYTRIDSNFGLGTAGWFNGDFNYDGKVNIDDYTIIDSNIGIQGAPFPTAGGIEDTGQLALAVPEPHTPGVMAGAGVAALTLLRLRRRTSASPDSQ